MSNAKELFLFHRNELLKSLEDGFDLDRNAAEFMMAYSNLDNEPSDSLSLMCKSASQKLLILRKENDEEGEVAETSAAESASSGSKSAMYLYGLKGLGSTPSKHPWIDKVVGTKNHHFRHAVWPFVEKDSKAHYKGVTPFDEDFYPLLRKNAVTGRRQFSELLRSMFIGGENEPLSKKHAKSELDWENHYLKSKNPLILGENKLYTGMGDDNKKNFNLRGRISRAPYYRKIPCQPE